MKLKTLMNHILIYSTGVIIFQLINFGTIKIYTSFFSLDEFGEISLILAVSALLMTTISGSQISNGLGRFYTDIKYSKYKKTIASTSFFTLLLFSLLTFTTVSFFSPSLKNYILSENRATILVFFVILYSFLTNISRFPSLIFKWNLKPWKYIYFSNISPVLTLLFVLVFSIAMGMRINGFILAIIMASVITSIFSYYKIKDKLAFTYDFRWAKKIIYYSLPLIPYTSSLLILTFSDRIFVKLFLGFEYTGIYTLGAKVAAILTALATGFRSAWGPFFFSSYRDENSDKKFSKVFDTFIFFSVAFIIIITAFSKEMVLLISNSDYFPSIKIIPFLLISNLIYNLQYFLLGIYIKNKTFYLSITSLIAIFVNIILNIVLIPYFEIIGAAIATATSFLIMFIFNMIISQRLYLIPYNLKKNMLFHLPWIFLTIIWNFLPVSIISSYFLKILILLLYIQLGHLFKIFDFNTLKELFKRDLFKKNK